MSNTRKAKYKFTFQNAQKARLALSALVNKRYLDRTGVVRQVKKIIIAPFDQDLLALFLKELNLLTDHDQILMGYECDEYAILFLVEAPNSRIDRYTIEEFENEFGVRSTVMEMAINFEETSTKAGL